MNDIIEEQKTSKVVHPIGIASKITVYPNSVRFTSSYNDCYIAF